MKIAIVANPGKQGAQAYFPEIASRLASLGAVLLLEDKDQEKFPFEGASYLQKEELYRECDLVLALGGDGTILHTVTYAAPLGKPVLGVNAGTLGFMAGLETNELYKLPRLFTGEYTLDRRMLLDVRIEGENAVYYALNDAVISKGTVSRILDLTVTLNGREIASYRADGVILSTQTGSTAYSLSAGGPVLDPEMDGMLVTPICPHSLFDRSILFKDDSVVSITASTRYGEGAYLTVDGRLGRALEPKDTVTIRKAAISAKLIRLKEGTFYETLTQKLMHRRG